MRSLPRVSIITTCYNHEAYLDDYFQGLLCQTYPNIELILVDDGSPDGSWAKIEGYLPRLRDRFSRVVAERHENIGALKELAWAMEAAEGEYVCILESDDYYLPDKIAENVAYLRARPEVGLVHSDTDYIFPERIVESFKGTVGQVIPSGWVHLPLLQGNFVKTCSICCRTELVRKYVAWERYASRGYLAGDYAMFLDLAWNTRFGYIGKSLAGYRVLEESASRSADAAKRFLFWRSLNEIRRPHIERYVRVVQTNSELGRNLGELCLSCAYWLREGGGYRDALGYYLLAGRLTGWDQECIWAVGKLLPHWMWRKISGARPASASFN